MASAGEKALHSALKSGTFDRVYLFHGEDDFLKDARTRELVAAAVDPATRDFNLELRRGPELDAETLDSLLSTPPLLAERRVVVVRDTEKLKKDARAVLARYLEHPAADTVLILVMSAGTKVDKALAARSLAVEFAPLTGGTGERDAIRLAPVVAYLPETEPSALATPAMVASMPIGMTVWPALYVAQQAPWQFASDVER